jgi:hypothetical protein
MKIGDKVRLKEDTDCPQGDAPAGLTGTINGYQSGACPFVVSWDNGFEFVVAEDEIELLNTGRWMREMPQKAGMYWTRTADGLEAGIVAVCALPDGQLFTPRYMDHQMVPGTTWGGWWWSEPVPPCPPWSEP